MTKSAKKTISDARWNAKAYFHPQVNIRREIEPDVRARAEELNMSMSSYILALIKKDLDEKIL